jgi:hypothetical protein
VLAPNEKTMKLRNILIILVIIAFSACTQKFCPTYADAEETPKVDQQEQKAL